MVSEGSMAENSSAKPFTNKSISIRLDDTNYLLWKQQIFFAIESLALADHINNSFTVLDQYLSSDRSCRINPEYACYKQEDNALYSWLLSSIGSSILSSLVNCKNVL
ncbi:hypothetical protein HRI_003592500 [Hibiscus trionum]|uniref:Retrotransposon Copia-like N-terminal domain-containing protein n=1 Tax=Hibiscus trionum TaxID=183268 RepID=A0A9W7IQI9_HIBTR|nr:hypothetical protein HRI_003592500 [Hibiscus trionum]